MKFEGKVSLITGGTSGIGAATALELARRGSDIAICGRKIDDKGRAVKEKVEALGRRCVLLAADMSKPSDIARLVRETDAQLGGVDVLVHAAGGAVPGSLMQVTPEAWYAAFDVHVHAIFHLSRAAVPVMKKRGGGAVVLISSAAGSRGCLGAIAYGTVKGALPQFARALARELADEKIRVNVVSPGVIRTPFQDYLTPEQAKHNIDNRIPLHREGKPEDVAEVIAMLAGNDFITGETLAIDGGMTMRIV